MTTTHQEINPTMHTLQHQYYEECNQSHHSCHDNLQPSTFSPRVKQQNTKISFPTKMTQLLSLVCVILASSYSSTKYVVESVSTSASSSCFIHTTTTQQCISKPCSSRSILPSPITTSSTRNSLLHARKSTSSGAGDGRGGGGASGNNQRKSDGTNKKKKKSTRRDATVVPSEQRQQMRIHRLDDDDDDEEDYDEDEIYDDNDDEEEHQETTRTATTSTSRSIKFGIAQLAQRTIAARGYHPGNPNSNGIDNLRNQQQPPTSFEQNQHQFNQHSLHGDNENNDDAYPLSSSSRPYTPPPPEDQQHPYQNNNDFYRSGTGNRPPPPPRPERVNSLRQLTAVIDDKLYGSGPRGTKAGNYPAIDGLVTRARDPMSSLLGYNHIKGDWREHVSDNPSDHSTYNVVIVFGKKLVRDQVTVEYASRIRALAKLFKENVDDDGTATTPFRPSLVCFAGPVRKGNHVSDADAGYIFFRHMCESQSIDLSGVDVFIDSQSKSEARAMQRIADEVRSKYVPKWLDLSSVFESRKDEYGLERSAPRKKVNLHFTLVSTEYHLCNMNDVHHRSPRQSALKSLQGLEDGLTIPSFSRRSSSSQDGYSPWSPHSGNGYSVGGRVYGNAYGSVGSYSDYEEEDEEEDDDSASGGVLS
mmetsp:Transcript_31230/g.46573  ORF Transcript_31230/g.46573 Transcript_31230/m.46573 type:complete len:643 (-) Transcript_31230:142-2070(-)